MPTKKVTVPKVQAAKEDPEIVQVTTRPTGKTEVIEVDAASTAPAIVLEKAHSVNEEPWTWFIAPDHITIVARSGKKYRFPLP